MQGPPTSFVTPRTFDRASRTTGSIRGTRDWWEVARTMTDMMPSKPPGTAHPWGEAATPYEEIGGEERVRQVAESFYDVIEAESPTLRAMLPASTRNTRQKFFMYLSGWLGGPPLYEQKWGHPRLRMRHMPFPIGRDEAAEWMRCMRQALKQVGVEEPLRAFLVERLEPLAQHMQNQP